MRLSTILLLASLLLILAVGGVSYWLYTSLHKPHEHQKSSQFITFEKGTTPNEIIDRLVSEGVIENGTATKIYLRTFGNAETLKAGDYQFASPVTPLQVLQELEKGEERTIKLTIPEGFTRFDIAKRLAEKFPTNPPTDEKQILRFMENTSEIKELAPTAENLEGYMFPSTYSFPIGTKPEDAVKRMVEQFKKIWTSDKTLKARAMGKTPHEIVTIASLIETESKFDKERPVVASVIYNRLAKNIPLGIDQTAVYIAKMQNRWDGVINKSDLEVDSPYNTRRFGGIPPGPISSVSESAIDAALNPVQTDYIFYVLNVENNDGSHNFYSSAAEFEKGKAAYQKWLATQRDK